MRFNKAQSAILSFVGFAVLLIFLNTVTQSSAQSDNPNLSVAWTTSGIPTLVGTNGHTLYTFARDENGASACNDTCAENWPPFTIDANMTVTFTDDVVGVVGTIQRSDGSTQITYNGSPLYYFSGDAAVGDDAGHGVRDLWFAANPADIMLGRDGLHLVGAGGMTLYVFTEDSGNDSFCLDECSREWPTLIAKQGTTPRLGAGLTGNLDVFQRSDGVMQISYNGWPLYFFHEDEEPGEMTGDGVKEVWFAADINLEQLQLPSVPNTPVAPTVFPTSAPSTGQTATPEETAEMTPEETAEQTPEATAEITPEQTAELTPESTP